MHLEHVNMTVSDLDRSIDFYTRLFDFQIRWQGKTSGGRRAAHVGSDRFYLAFFEAIPGAEGRERDYERPGFNHVGFVVEDIDDLKKRLEELGHPAHADDSYNPGRHAYFADPDGLEIELVSYAPAEVPLPA